MNRFDATRRALLARLGLASAAMLVGPRQVMAQKDAVPRRFLGLWHANGWRVLPRDHKIYQDPEQKALLDQMFFPAKRRGGDYELSSITTPWPSPIAPLARHAKHLTILDGLANPSNGWAEPHPHGAMSFFSGAAPIPGQVTSGGISLDQYLSAKDGRALSGLHVGVGQRVPRVRISHSGKAQPNLSEIHPTRAYEQLMSRLVFASSPDAQKQELAALRRRKKSALDLHAKELASMRPWLGKTDRARLDTHAQAIRRVEQRLDAMARSHAACQAPNAPQGLDPFKDEDTPQISAAMLDLLTVALACDITRVGTMFYGYSTGSFVPTWLGALDPLHVMSHWPHQDPRQSMYEQSLAWISGQVASLLDRLAAIPERDGQSLLYHTLMLWGTDVGSGQIHSIEDIPVLLLGNASGRLKTGWVKTLPQDTPINRLLLAIASAFGRPTATFGEASDCKDGPLPGLFSAGF